MPTALASLERWLPPPLLRPGPFDIVWWQWIALPGMLALAWTVRKLLGWLTRRLVGRLAERTSTQWDDLPIGIYQGGITLAASSVTPYLTLPVLNHADQRGRAPRRRYGLDLLAIKRLPLGNLLPGVFMAPLLAYFLG